MLGLYLLSHIPHNCHQLLFHFSTGNVSDTDKLRQYKKKLARLYKQVDNHDKAIEVLSELTEDQESGQDVLVSCWEILVDVLLYRLERKPSIKDMEQVTITLIVLCVNSNRVSTGLKSGGHR